MAGFCRRCGDIIRGADTRCKCGGSSACSSDARVLLQWAIYRIVLTTLTCALAVQLPRSPALCSSLPSRIAGSRPTARNAARVQPPWWALRVCPRAPSRLNPSRSLDTLPRALSSRPPPLRPPISMTFLQPLAAPAWPIAASTPCPFTLSPRPRPSRTPSLLSQIPRPNAGFQ